VSSLPHSVDVLVIGGGPAGLATAIASRRRGLSVVVADGAIPPIDKACGEGLMPDGVDALQHLGIAISPREAYPFRGIRFLSDGKQAEARFARGIAYGIRRINLHRILIDNAAASGVHLLWRVPVTGLHPEGALIGGEPVDGALVDGELIRARWVVGADGARSRVRAWAKLDRPTRNATQNRNLRYGFRRHYRVAPWTDFVELHWGHRCQIYVTPVSHDEIGVVLISSDPKLRLQVALDETLDEFPELRARLANAEIASGERGATTVTRRFRRIYRGRVVLVGDASGGVDAITGEGLCLGFQQAVLLGDCLASGDLARYERGHRSLLRRPTLMARMMLFLAKHSQARRRTMQVFRSSPHCFAQMLATHLGQGSAREHISSGISLGWKLLRV
jgi:menaquinone-9 beta-reductase